MGAQTITTPGQLREAYRKTKDRIAAAAQKSGRDPGSILLIAVTKYATPDQIRLLVEMGHQDFAENRVQQLQQRAGSLQEFLQRRKLLGSAVDAVSVDVVKESASKGKGSGGQGGGTSGGGVRWHMIGHLQRNKIKHVVPMVRLIHSVDSLRLAEDLQAFGNKTDRVIDLLIQVNVSGETTKYGISPPAITHLAEQIESMANLRLRGLMAMAPYSERAEDARPVFGRCAELFAELKSSRVGGANCNILSMGMSHDYEVAIEEGANVVRLGTAIFGSSGSGGTDEEDVTRGAPGSEEGDEDDGL